MLRVFTASYNKAQGTHYDKWQDGPPGADYDHVCEGAADEPPLRIQHTRAWADPELEWRHPKEVEQFVVRTLRDFLSWEGIVDRHISIDVDRLPTARGEKVELAKRIAEAVQVSVRNSADAAFPLLAGFTRDDVLQFYDPIRNYVKTLEVHAVHPPKDQAATVGWSSMGAADNGVADSATRVLAAIQKKEERYQGTSTDLILLVDFEIMPYFDDEPERIRAALAGQPPRFREVWITKQWVPPSAHRVWP